MGVIDSDTFLTSVSKLFQHGKKPHKFEFTMKRSMNF